MKSEEGVVQELERDRQQEAANSGAAPPPLGQSTRFMIAGEAPVLLGKACELLIKELTVRAWRHTERNRRRTLQRQDIHAAVGESEVFDFLIDIVPRVTTSQLPQKSFPSDPTAPQTTTASQAMVPVSGTRETTATGEAEARMHHIQQMHEHMQDAYAMQMHQARLQAEAQVATTQTVGQSTMMGAPPSFGMQSTPDGTLPQWAPNGNTGMPQ
jgi:nuclear transcription factor Y, gamma